jgi:cytochrome d ubiquinol oxidase subunit I
MDPTLLSRWQFAITTIYHFFFVPLTLGLSIFIALIETKYVLSKDETYKRMVKFWGSIFVINFAAGVVTGIVQEFHFGLNWSEYSRFVGEIFGAPLAMETLLAFFMESTFIGLWIFGWDKLSKKFHLTAAWLVAIATNVSGYAILVANSFMQHPVGYALEQGRAVVSNFRALFTNPNMLYQYPHVLAAGISTAGFLVLAFSSYHLGKKKGDLEPFRISFRWAAIYSLIGVALVIFVGDAHGKWLGREQPMKVAAAEAAWETEQPADFSVFAIIDEENQENKLAFKIPNGLSFLLHNNFTGKVMGIKDLQEEAIEKYGPGDYTPPVILTFWAFRFMVGLGFLMLLLAFLALIWRKSIEKRGWFLKIAPLFIFLPYLASSFGWIVTEEARQPWVVYGLLRVKDAVSPNLTVTDVMFSLVILFIVESILVVITAAMFFKYGTSQPAGVSQDNAAY